MIDFCCWLCCSCCPCYSLPPTLSQNMNYHAQSRVKISKVRNNEEPISVSPSVSQVQRIALENIHATQNPINSHTPTAATPHRDILPPNAVREQSILVATRNIPPTLSERDLLPNLVEHSPGVLTAAAVHDGSLAADRKARASFSSVVFPPPLELLPAIEMPKLVIEEDFGQSVNLAPRNLVVERSIARSPPLLKPLNKNSISSDS